MSGLFGGPLNTGTSQAGGSSLFGASTATSRPPPSNLFGTATTQSQPTSTLFGSLGSSQAQQQPASQATAGASNPLFGRIGTSTSQPQQSTSAPSLFGSLGASTSQPPQPTAGGLFGATTTAAGQSTLAPSASTAQAAQSQGPLAQSTASTLQSAYFDNLLERGKKRNRRENGSSRFGELPSLQLGLGDIARKVQKLNQGGPPAAQQARDSRVHYLLAASGVSTGAALRDWQSFATQAGLSTTGASGPVDTDLEGYIANLQSQSTLAMISEGLEQSKRDFDTFLENNVQMEWDAQRRRIYEHLGLAKPSEDPDASQGDTASLGARGGFGRSSRRGPVNGSSRGGMSFKGSTMPRSVIGTPGAKGFARSTAAMESPEKSVLSTAPENRFTRDKQEKFAAKLRQLNLARLRDEVYPILKEFAEVEQSSGTDTTPQLVDAYRALIEITGENANVHRPTDPGAVRERQYVQEYLDENPTSVPAVSIRTRILNGSRQFLEKKFFEEVETAIEKNPREANLGGIPTTINKVRAYIRLRAARKELGPENVELQKIGDDYCWVLIFYLIRCGLFQEAVAYVEENDRAIKNIDRHFHQYLRSYASNPNRRISRELQNMVQTEYQRRIRLSPENSIDPYRLACLKVLGRCELNKRNLDGLNQGVDDWVWLQFCLAREINRAEDAAAESFGLDELRSTISEIGQKHFSDRDKEGPAGSGVFFLLQMLGGMFEEAVFYLAQTNHVSAVHFAIALDFYGLLRVSDFATSGPDLLSFTTTQKPQINFPRMVGLYTMEFRQAKAEAACDYLTLICLNADLPGQAGQNHAEVCHEALRELVLETREFVQLIGDVRNDGKRIQGAIPQRMKLIKLATQENFLRRVTQGAALIADNSGRTVDAVLLYFLAEDHSKVIDVTIRAVSDALAVELGQPTKLEPLKSKPDDTNASAGVDDPSGSTLSSMSVDDPAALSTVISRIYMGNMNVKLRSSDQRALRTLELLYTMMLVRKNVEAGNWSRAIDFARNTDLLPLHAGGDPTLIRKCSSNFATLDHTITRNIGAFIMWCIMACGQQRRVLLSSGFEDPTRKAMADEFMGMARDLMVYAGLIRYKLPPRVYEALAEAGQDVGA